jgi:hypothetical protein
MADSIKGWKSQDWMEVNDNIYAPITVSPAKSPGTHCSINPRAALNVVAKITISPLTRNRTPVLKLAPSHFTDLENPA